MSLVKLIDFNLLGDERGHLTVLEANKNIPFDIKRVYYLTGTLPGVSSFQIQIADYDILTAGDRPDFAQRTVRKHGREAKWDCPLL